MILPEITGDIEDLNKEQIIARLKQVGPRFHPFNNDLVKWFGELVHDTWVWNDERLQEARVSQLIKVYNFCKNSWL